MTLPGGFGYILNEVFCAIVVNVANDFEAFCVFSLHQSSRANKDFDYRIPIAMELCNFNGASNNVRASALPSGILTRTPIVPQAGGSNASLAVTDRQDTAGAAGNIDVLMSFWEYDLEQLTWFSPHSAANVLSR